MTAHQQAKDRGGLARAGRILAIIGVALVAIPPFFPPMIVFSALGWVLLAIALVMSIVGYVRVRRRQPDARGAAVGGMLLSLVGFVVTITWSLVIYSM